MSSRQSLHVEIVGPNQEPTNPNSFVVREISPPNYYIEPANVLLKPMLDSNLVVTFTTGELAGSEITAPTYAYKISNDIMITFGSHKGVLTHSISAQPTRPRKQ
jgi:hypothetical protein